MKLSTLLTICCLAILLSALAFICYVPVLNILTTVVVAFAIVGAFGAGFFFGSMSPSLRRRVKSAVVIAIDRPMQDRWVLTAR